MLSSAFINPAVDSYYFLPLAVTARLSNLSLLQIRAIGSRSTRLVGGGTRGGSSTIDGFDVTEWTVVAAAGVAAAVSPDEPVRAMWVSDCNGGRSLDVVVVVVVDVSQLSCWSARMVCSISSLRWPPLLPLGDLSPLTVGSLTAERPVSRLICSRSASRGAGGSYVCVPYTCAATSDAATWLGAIWSSSE